MTASFALRPLTHREIPFEDPSVDALPAPERAEVAQMWRGRCETELRVAASFAVIAREVMEVGGLPEVIGLLSRAVADETRHAELCRRLASRYSAADVAWPPAEPLFVPPHEGADDRLRTTLHVIGMCCINETMGSAFLETSLDQAVAPLAKCALRDILTDEIDHARVGWTHVASADRATRQALAGWVPRLLAASYRMYQSQNVPSLVGGVPEHGLPSIADTEACARGAIRDLVLPGFEQLGVDVRACRAWLQSITPAEERVALTSER